MAYDLIYNIAFSGTSQEIKRLSQLAAKIKEVRALIANPQASVIDVEKNKLALKAYEQGYRNLQSAQSRQLKSYKDESGSLNSLRAELNHNKASYDALSKAERESATNGQALLKSINQLDIAIKKIEADTGRFQKNVGNYPKTFGEALSSIKMGYVAVAGAITGAIASVVKFVEAYDQEIQAHKKLGNALDGRINMTRHLIDYAKELEGITTVPEHAIVEMESFLAAQGRTETQIKKTIQAAIQLSAVTGKDLDASVKMLDSSYSGVLKGLNRLDPRFKELSKTQLANGAAIDLVNEKYKGFAEVAAQEGIGPIKQLGNAWEHIKESIGGAVAGAILPAVQSLKKLTEALNETIEPHKAESEIMKETLNSFNLEVNTLKNANLSQEARKQLLTEINSKYKEYLPQLLTEKMTIEDISDIQNKVNQNMMTKIIMTAYQDKITEQLKKELKAREGLANIEIEEGKQIQKNLDMTDVQAKSSEELAKERFGTKSRELIKGYNNAVIDSSGKTKDEIKAIYQQMAKDANISWEAIIAEMNKKDAVSGNIEEGEKERLKREKKEMEDYYKAYEQQLKEFDELYQTLLDSQQLSLQDQIDHEIEILENKASYDTMSLEEQEIAKQVIRDKYRKIEAENQTTKEEKKELSIAQKQALDDTQFALEQADQEYKGKKALLDKELLEGKIGHQRYAKDVAKLDEELKNIKIKNIQQSLGHAASLFKQNTITYKALSIADATISTWTAAAAALKLPFPFNWIQEALVIASGMEDVAKIAGIGVKAERGALIGGNRHSQGGTMVNAEEGETIINRRSSAVFRPMLSAINSYNGWGVPFAERGMLIPASNSIQGMSREEAVQMFQTGLESIRVHVLERDITSVQSRVKVAEYENRF
jgi:hypothetical protein